MVDQQGDPRIREQAVRMLGRDCRENGHVEYTEARGQAAAGRARRISTHSWPLADDPDAGVRRELILAFRNLPTDKVGDALQHAGRVVGRPGPLVSRGARPGAREARERLTCRSSSTARSTATWTSSEPGKHGKVALPPYFPVDRNEAFIAAGTPDLPATALSKYLGLAWRLHRREVLPLLERIAPHLRRPELQQAADDILERMKDPRGGRAGRRPGVTIRRPGPAAAAVMPMLARRLAGDWNAAHERPERHAAASSKALAERRDQRSQGIALAAATRDGALSRDARGAWPQDAKAPDEVRVAAVEAIGSFHITPNRVLEQLIASVRGKPSSNPVAEAAVRAMARRSGRERPADRPLDRRATTRWACAARRCGPWPSCRTAARACSSWPRAGKLPDDLKTEATTLLLHARPTAGSATRRPRSCRCPRRPRGRPLAADRRADPPRGRRRPRPRRSSSATGTNACGELPPRAGAAGSGSAPTSRRSASSTARTS